MIDKLQTGKRIAIMRKKIGLSQSALAEKLNITTQAVSKWECGLALPDIDLLAELSWLFCVSINSLIECGEYFTLSVALNPVRLSEQTECILKNKEDRKLLCSVAPYFSELEISEIARQTATGNLKLKCVISATSGEKNKSVNVELSQLSESVLRELSPFTSEVSNIAVGDIPRAIKRIADLLICPKCGEKMELNNNGDEISFSCLNSHTAKIVDGVICFDTREIPGEQWSLSLRNYEHYLEWQNWPGNPNYKRGRISGDVIWEQLSERKPKIILDIASGMGGGVGSFIDKIDWQCMIVLTDLSYRILSWDKKYFETVKANPYVDLVYIACDCAKMPVKSELIDVVLSHCGFESMQDKRMNGFTEAYRILKDKGSAIYNMSIVEDKSTPNTQKWMDLTRSLRGLSEQELSEQYIEIGEWLSTCEKYGYKKTQIEKLYSELPAPDTDTFPYENEIMQWMCNYICFSEK